MTKELILKNFIEKCNILYNNYYDYSKVVYKNMKEKVIIICPKHGEFLIKPHCHLEKRGCKKCGNNMLSKSEFIDQANIIHNFRYDYTNSDYIKKEQKIIIKCKVHGDFSQSPLKHLRGQGCAKCTGKNKTKDEIILEFKKVHGDLYDYSLIEYVNPKTKIKIICKKHGIFEQEYYSHKMKNGCPHCGFNTSLSGNEYIKSFNNNNIIPEKTLTINHKRFKVDGFDPTTNTIYEYFGSFWHGHPDRKDLIGLHPFYKIPYTEVYQKTLDRIKWFQDNDYKAIYKWGR